MIKMFTTQLTGVFKKIAETEEFSLEDAARLLAQGPAGDGSIYIYGAGEMEAVGLEAVSGAEPLSSGKILTEDCTDQLTSADRVLLVSRFSTDEGAVRLADRLADQGIPFVSVCSVADSAGETSSPAERADVLIDLRLTRGLLPDEEGNRFGFPSSMAALFVYFCLRFTIDEILSEYEE